MGDGSLGYAERLSFRAELGGTLGEPEIADANADVATKVAKLAKMISDSQHLVVFTGAGISTACGIPDFRGPNGVWTKQRRGEALPKASIAFEHARPSITHQALLALQRSGKLKYLVSQNVDSLHLRSGFPREQLAELHGNCFAERCDACGKEYVRDFELCSVGFKSTGRRCTACKGALRDHCLDWDNALPEDELQLAESHSTKADLVLCLGTSLVITPACDIPLLAKRKRKHKPNGGRVAIINLQATQHDKRAALVVHARVDEVMAAVMSAMSCPLPDYVRTDTLLVSHEVEAELTSSLRAPPRRTLHIHLTSAHGPDCPLPWLETCVVSFSHLPEGPCVRVSAPEPAGDAAGAAWTCAIPLEEGDANWAHDSRYTALLALTFAPGTTAPPRTLHYSFTLQREPTRRRASGTMAQERFELITCRAVYNTPAHSRPPPHELHSSSSSSPPQHEPAQQQPEPEPIPMPQAEAQPPQCSQGSSEEDGQAGREGGAKRARV